ncbi:hypothetical protein E4U21_001813 [Claviceps maximensis]|nr:hypothetical protein E4U21_001813 [Claviceps maximensis]
MIPGEMPPSTLAYTNSVAARDPWNRPHSALAVPYASAGFAGFYGAPSNGINHNGGLYNQSAVATRNTNSYHSRADIPSSASPANYVSLTQLSGAAPMAPVLSAYQNAGKTGSWDGHGRYSPTGSLEDMIASPSLSDYSVDNVMMGLGSPNQKPRSGGKRGSQRRPSNRDEFDGPHQFLQRPPQEVIDMQERELPHLPTNLHVQEQDAVLTQVNDRLSQCAFDFVAKYQFPIPLTQDMRPVERPQDREWTEWVYLLKRLATKRRIPARVLYNGQIKQFVTILENSLEMRHAAKHQSRPLKDDRNILQLISAGIQVAKILKDASAMEYLDRLYVDTEARILERTKRRFRS